MFSLAGKKQKNLEIYKNIIKERILQEASVNSIAKELKVAHCTVEDYISIVEMEMAHERELEMARKKRKIKMFKICQNCSSYDREFLQCGINRLYFGNRFYCGSWTLYQPTIVSVTIDDKE